MIYLRQNNDQYIGDQNINKLYISELGERLTYCFDSRRLHWMERILMGRICNAFIPQLISNTLLKRGCQPLWLDSLFFIKIVYS